MVKESLATRFLLLTWLFFISLAIQAQSQGNEVYAFAKVVNSFTGEALANVHVIVTDEQSNSSDTIVTKGVFHISGEDVNFFQTLQRGRHYSFLFSLDGYEPVYLELPIKIGRRERYVSLGVVELKKQNTHKDVLLDEVIVKASKVKMVMDGDTLVFNADAFQLSNGSMLDDLIRRLPGVQLSGSTITVNGRFVSSLLVNGDDFFRGDPSVALENLPAYTVKNIKVYERQNDIDHFVGKKKNNGQEPLVMDVQLKKEYAQGFLANADAGVGTGDRWLSRVFGLRFTKNSRIGLFGNLNNTNDTRMPGTNGDWNPAWQATGSTTMRSVGADYLFSRPVPHERNSKGVGWKLQGNTKYLHQNIKSETRTASERFLDGGNTFSRADYNGRDKQTTVQSDNRMTLEWKRVRTELDAGFEYRKIARHAISRSATFNHNPADRSLAATLDSVFVASSELRADASTVNSLFQQDATDGHLTKGKFEGILTWRVPHTPDNFTIRTRNAYNESKSNDLSLYALAFSSGSDHCNRYFELGGKDLKSEWSMSYAYIKEYVQEFKFSYCHAYNKGMHNLYLLNGRSDLPSTRDTLLRRLDADNSYHSNIYSDRFELSTSLVVPLPNNPWHFVIDPGLNYRIESIRYHRGSYINHHTRKTFCFEPSISFNKDDFVNTYKLVKTMAPLADQMAVTNDEDPLRIWQGNPRLKNSETHRFTVFRVLKNKRKHSSANIRLEWNIIRHAIGVRQTYNRATGVTTTQPDNISGNWNASGQFGFTKVVDKGQRFTWSTDTYVGYANSVDFVSAISSNNLPESQGCTRSSVRNQNIKETLALEYNHTQYVFGLRIKCDYHHATSPQKGFNRINTADVGYGFHANVKLPWKVKLTTDLTLYSRYGYSDHVMNTNDLVWNGRVERTFGKFIFMLDGFDILHQLSNVRRVINAQGRTETWYNTVPSYAMLHVVYRLHVKPKKAL